MATALTPSARAIVAIPLCAFLALAVVFALPFDARTEPVIAAAFAASAVVAYLLVTGIDLVLIPDSATTTRLVDIGYDTGWVAALYGPFFGVAAVLTFWLIGAYGGDPAWWHRYAPVAGGLVGLGVGAVLFRGSGVGGTRQET